MAINLQILLADIVAAANANANGFVGQGAPVPIKLNGKKVDPIHNLFPVMRANPVVPVAVGAVAPKKVAASPGHISGKNSDKIIRFLRHIEDNSLTGKAKVVFSDGYISHIDVQGHKPPHPGKGACGVYENKVKLAKFQSSIQTGQMTGHGVFHYTDGKITMIEYANRF